MSSRLESSEVVISMRLRERKLGKVVEAVASVGAWLASLPGGS